MSTLAGLSKKASKKALPWGQSKDSGEKGSGSKMSFSLGPKASSVSSPVVKKSALSKSKSEREKEDRKKSDAEATAEVYAEFVASFEETPSGQSKAFVRGSVVNTERDEASGRKGALYKPTSRLSESLKERALSQLSSFDTAGSSSVGAVAGGGSSSSGGRGGGGGGGGGDGGGGDGSGGVGLGILGAYPGEGPSTKPKRPKEKEKAKSNLELFKEELKREQEERDERHRLKKTLQQEAVRIGATPPALQKIMAIERDSTGAGGSHDHGDPQTTNLYVGNLSPQMNEELLCLTFGKYGPLASVKIMWPRTDEEKARNRMCGFVAFMCRDDGGQALAALNGKEVMGFELKMGWGKSVPIPPVPFYVAPELQSSVAATMPPPPSGKPFNAQARDAVKPGARRNNNPAPGSKGHDDKLDDLRTLVIPVVIPHDRNLLCVIHRVIEFVVREGPMFEAMIMNKEINNPMFRFLFDNKEPAHIYYRWKLYSILQGERADKWRLNEFSMFKSGSIWRPPPMPQMKTTLKAPAVEDSKAAVVAPVLEKKGQLSEKHRDQLEEMLHKITCDRQAIADGMLFCLDHADCAVEIVECITESLSILETPIPLKAARLFLVSDILYNCSAGVPHASHFRRGFESRLVEIFQHLHGAFQAISGRFRADKFQQQVSTCIRAWEDCAVYPPMFLVNLREVFLGQEDMANAISSDVDHAAVDLDGVPVAGVGLDGIAVSQPELMDDASGADLDGAPLDLDGEPVVDGDNAEDDDNDVDFTERIHSAAPPPPKPRLPAAPEQPRMLSKWEMVDEGAEDEEDSSSVLVSKSPQPVRSSGSTSSRGEASSASSFSVSTNSSSTHTSAGSTSAGSAYGDVESEEKRRRLREIEVKVVEYADRLEAKAKRKGRSMDIQMELEKYRQELLREYDSASESDDGARYNLVADEDDRSRSKHASSSSHRSSGSNRATASGDSGGNSASVRHSGHSTAHRSRSVSSGSRSPSPSDTGEYGRQRSKRKRSHSPSYSTSSRKHKRAKSPSRKKSPQARNSKRHSRSRSRSPVSPSRSPGDRRRKHRPSSSSHHSSSGANDHSHSSSKRKK